MARVTRQRQRSQSNARQHIASNLADLIRQHVDDHVRGGFLSDTQIVEAVLSGFPGEAPVSALRREAKRFTKAARLAVVADSKEWPKVTDCDRLDLAFAELNDDGVLARQNFSCCTTCGVDEIDRELRSSKHSSKTGYVFFTRDDVRHAVHGLLFLAFGSRDATPASMRRIARAALDHLRRHKLKARWSGDADEKILIRVTWQNRRSLPVTPRPKTSKPRSGARPKPGA